MAIYSVSIRDLRPRLPEVVADVSENMTRYVITKRGKPSCVIISTDDYDCLVESLGLQSDWKLMRELADSKSTSKKARPYRLDDIRKGL